ncbi:phosphomevalonate kinase [Oceanobacillus zhaokaii]|uniref:phosphomevalonate kinase n=1 Tax=Oceanobacillus zhaokaii TaxID=2052660 RepID=A0A345PM32_9BACI|nr:phosphomevalonate kinase [Oceanobacillus zhaokaii]AXI11062.1 phosphomevalonate kinase [Oceanobacillus zhaokaii]
MTIKVPGKLMIAGEFAVLEPYHNLAVLAVDRFVYAKIEGDYENRLTLLDFQLENLAFDFINNKVNIAINDRRTRFVGDAMTIALTYLKEQGLNPEPFHLSIKSELDDESGVKYGLGSSAAVVTSVVTAILTKFLAAKPAEELIFKLAAISHVETQGNGSGADVAASSYGGLLRYASFQAEWLHSEYIASNSISDLVAKEWRYFSVKPMKLPQNIHFCVGWTGKPASTAKLVDVIRQLKSDNLEQYEKFLHDSEAAVGTFFKGMEEESVADLLEGVKANRQALATVGKHANAPIETPLLATLCNLAEQFGGAGKPSGAGGGDCGIAFMPSREQATELMRAWEEAGIKPLALQPNSHGAMLIE